MTVFRKEASPIVVAYIGDASTVEVALWHDRTAQYVAQQCSTPDTLAK